MEEEKFGPADHHHSMQYCSAGITSPEIVEIGEDSKSVGNGGGAVDRDIYVAVGKHDLDVLKWTLDHAASPGVRIFLVHVFPPITYINTPVGPLARSQLKQEQVRVYINEENNKRRNLLQKYIRLCTDAKVLGYLTSVVNKPNINYTEHQRRNDLARFIFHETGDSGDDTY